MTEETYQWETRPPVAPGWYWAVPRTNRHLRIVQIFPAVTLAGKKDGMRYSHLESHTASSALTDSSFHAYRRMTEEPPSLQGVPL